MWEGLNSRQSKCRSGKCSPQPLNPLFLQARGDGQRRWNQAPRGRARVHRVAPGSPPAASTPHCLPELRPKSSQRITVTPCQQHGARGQGLHRVALWAQGWPLGKVILPPGTPASPVYLTTGDNDNPCPQEAAERSEGESGMRGAQQAASTRHSLGFVCRGQRGKVCAPLAATRCHASAWCPRAMTHWALLICTCFPGFFVNVHSVCLWVKMQACELSPLPPGPLPASQRAPQLSPFTSEPHYVTPSL